jgi:membrane protease YdiL (CAAX protease family)
MAEGWSGYRTLGARMIHWRVGGRWWIVALGMPLAVLVVAALANIAIWGVPAPVLGDMAWPTLALVFAVRFVNPLDGPLGEEPGWRGYAVPQLQAGRAPLSSLVCLWRCGTCRW